MVKKLGILGFILVVVVAAGTVWAQTYAGATPAPQPTLMPAGGGAPAKVAVKAPCIPKLTTSIKVKMKYPQPVRNPFPMAYSNGCEMRPAIPVAVPMWKFIVPWPPFVYYLPVE
jgi:hypothetical protein